MIALKITPPLIGIGIIICGAFFVCFYNQFFRGSRIQIVTLLDACDPILQRRMNKYVQTIRFAAQRIVGTPSNNHAVVLARNALNCFKLRQKQLLIQRKHIGARYIPHCIWID